MTVVTGSFKKEGVKTVKKGLHISFTGIDGSGKTTQARRLVSELRNKDMNAIFYEEKRNFVQEAADIIARKEGKEYGRKCFDEGYYLFAMSFELLRRKLEKISPYLDSGVTIVTSRCIFDWIAGSIARNCSRKDIKRAEKIMTIKKAPDLTLWLDINPLTAKQRIDLRGYDKMNLNYLKKYRAGFEEISQRYEIEKIDAEPILEKVQKIVEERVNSFLKKG